MFVAPLSASLNASEPTRKFVANTLSTEDTPVKPALLLERSMASRGCQSLLDSMEKRKCTINVVAPIFGTRNDSPSSSACS